MLEVRSQAYRPSVPNVGVRPIAEAWQVRFRALSSRSDRDTTSSSPGSQPIVSYHAHFVRNGYKPLLNTGRGLAKRLRRNAVHEYGELGVVTHARQLPRRSQSRRVEDLPERVRVPQEHAVLHQSIASLKKAVLEANKTRARNVNELKVSLGTDLRIAAQSRRPRRQQRWLNHVKEEIRDSRGSALLDDRSLILVGLPDLQSEEHQRNKHRKPLTKLPMLARSERVMSPPTAVLLSVHMFSVAADA